MKTFLAVLFILVLAGTSEATTRYVKTTCTNNITTYDPVKDVCTGGSDRVYSTIANALSAGTTVAGDTLDVRAGTYTVALNGANVPSGGGEGSRVTIQCHTGETCNQTGSISLEGPSYVTFSGFKMTGGGGIWVGSTNADGSNVGHHIRFINMEVASVTADNLVNVNHWGHHVEIIGGSFHNATTVGATCSASGSNACYAFYMSGKDNLIERANVYSNPSYGIHSYSGYGAGQLPDRNVYRYNNFYSNGGNSGTVSASILLGSGDSQQAYGNIVHDNPGDGIASSNGATNSKIYNNTVYNNNTLHTGYGGILWGSGNTTTIKNNISYSNYGGDFVDSGGGAQTPTLGSNHCTNTGTGCATTGNPQFVNAAGGDFSLLSTSPVIDQGTSTIATGITLTCAGGCDIGAYEVPKIASCAVAKNVLSITFDNPRFPPISNPATTGITAIVDGSTRTLSNAAVLGTNIVTFDFTGAAASATASTVGTSVAITDTANIGGLSANRQKVLNWASTGCNVTGGGSQVLTQTYFRFHDLPGTEAAPKCLSASGSCSNMQNVAATVQQGGSFRVRGKIACTGASCLTAAYEWRYNKDGGSYARVPDTVSTDRISYYGTTDTSADVPAQGTQTTELLTSDYSTNVTGAVIRTAVAIPSINSPAQNSEWEMEGIFHFERDASAGSVFCFRLYNQDGTALNAYNATPCATVAAPALGGGQMGALSPLGPWDLELRLGSEMKLGTVRRRATDLSRFVYPEVPKSAVVKIRQ